MLGQRRRRWIHIKPTCIIVFAGISIMYISLTLAYRLRRLANIKSTSGQCLMIAGWYTAKPARSEHTRHHDVQIIHTLLFLSYFCCVNEPVAEWSRLPHLVCNCCYCHYIVCLGGFALMDCHTPLFNDCCYLTFFVIQPTFLLWYNIQHFNASTRRLVNEKPAVRPIKSLRFVH